MKKLSLLLSVVIFLTLLPMTAAASGIQVILNNKPIVFSDAQPFKKGTDVWIPLRQSAQAMGMKIGLTKGTDKVQLTDSLFRVSLRIGTNSAVMNEEQTVSYGAAAISKANRIYVPLTFFSKVFGFETAYDNDRSEVVIGLPKNFDDIFAPTIVELLNTGAYQQLSDNYFDETIKPLIPVKALQAGWEQTIATAGNFIGIHKIQSNTNDTVNKEINVTLNFSKENVALLIHLNESGKIIGLRLAPLQPEAALPSGLTEEDVTVGAGSAYPLEGTLTLPKNATGPVPAVVLVQGSGPSDRDETAGGYKPFRDIAWGLAQQGIAVLRYDKRTFVYGKSFTPEMLTKFTVKEETVDDAIAASKLLKGDKRIDPSQVYVVGHSLGGMLAPRIDNEGGDFAGLVILAGSTRSLWEIIADQNADFIRAMDDKDPKKKANENWLAAEKIRAEKLSSLSDKEAIEQTLFGIPALYFKEMDQHGAQSLVSRLSKPILIMQGEDDFQVFAKDYSLWQEHLKNNAKASFKLYPGLNHFFVNYEGKDQNTVEEYNHPGNVDKQVILDIGQWINKQ